MELISKISKGSLMDQIYLPKRRAGFNVGSYVVVKPLQEIKTTEKPFFYNIDFLEPIKIGIINQIFEELGNLIDKYDNIMVTGSFLEKGFNFNDIDILLITESETDKSNLEKSLESKTGIKIHIISINNKTLIQGLSTDPLFQTMLSRCVSKKRFIYNIKPEINYKILDLHLLKSKLLIENFDFSTGKEKYEMLRNAVSIALFIDGKIVDKELVDKEIKRLFGKDNEIKENIILDKKAFLAEYKKFYNNLFSRILGGVKNGSKQK